MAPYVKTLFTFLYDVMVVLGALFAFAFVMLVTYSFDIKPSDTGMVVGVVGACAVALWARRMVGTLP